jgi:hypothetical protein
MYKSTETTYYSFSLNKKANIIKGTKSFNESAIGKHELSISFENSAHSTVWATN